MSELYGETHRAFQDLHDTRRLADRLETLAHAEFDSSDRAFIESARKAARPALYASTGAPSSSFRSMTEMACFYPLAISQARHR
jgi:hypothetical protein